MTKLEGKLQNALDEIRMLVLGVEVLIGFGFRAFLEPGFDRLQRQTQWLKLAVLVLLIVALALLLSPPTDHQLRHGGEVKRDAYRYATVLMTLALAPFGLSLALDLQAALMSVASAFFALIVAALSLALIALAWFGPLAFRRRRNVVDEEQLPTAISIKVRQVLTEARVILPGAQALLGFGLVATLMDGFSRLPASSQWVHIFGLLSVAAAIVLLMTPAAYHRLAEKGEDTEQFHAIATRLVLAALVPLGLAIACGLYIAVERVSHSPLAAALTSASVFVGLMIFWFAAPLLRRRHDRLTSIDRRADHAPTAGAAPRSS